MKQYAIRRLYSYFETTSQEIENSAFDEKLEALDEELKSLLAKYGLELINQDTRFVPLEKMSAKKCDQCTNLMINRDKNPARFNKENLWIDLDSDYNCVIWDGGTHDGTELCMECLPIEHRWGYYSWAYCVSEHEFPNKNLHTNYTPTIRPRGDISTFESLSKFI